MKPSNPSQTNITPGLQEIFNAITSGEYRNFALFSCFVNGEPAAAIVAIPVALIYNLFLDRFIAGFTLGAVKG